MYFLQVTHSFVIPGVEPKIIVMGKNDTLMFITYPGGFVASLNYPIQDPVEYNEYHYHCADIAHVIINKDIVVIKPFALPRAASNISKRLLNG
jgi:hypothetical protein